MSIARSLPVLIVLAAMTALPGCATTRAARSTALAADETISISVGACFGFCPVYTIRVTPGGTITFDGDRHTAQLGRKTREGGRDSYRNAAAALAPFRPQTGSTSETACKMRISDQQHYQISWTAADGTVTKLDHDKGCRSPRTDMLNTALQALPAQLGIEDWARQMARPGASRG